MDIIIFSIIAIILISLIVYLTINRKVKCHQCFSRDITQTGQKRYSEDNLAMHGSPNSYHELEYKCNKCGNVFWAPKVAAIFN
jgi:DNA-directed RNA polymerase subunit RPC12/RpoP